MPDYQKAKIYRIVNDNMPGKVYYGSTCQKLSMRMSTHRCNARSKNNSSKELFEIGKPVIVLIENFPCDSKEELLKRERFYIENNDCVNKQIPGRTQQECNKEWRENNKEYNKQYRIDNHAEILIWKNTKTKCECGLTYTQNHFARHKKSARHIKLMETV